ncbi:MAG: hypothetical protein U0401_02755, partial [Anaerolineae bacterium]
MLKISLLGQFNLQVDGQTIDLPSRPAQSLLAYLALHAGTAQRREKLAGLLWPETTESNARSNLRHALWRIRKTLSPNPQTSSDYFEADDFAITFAANHSYWLDTALLEQKVSQSEPVEELIKAVSLYRGELLPG